MQYAIVRLIKLSPGLGSCDSRDWTVACVYGPYDEQGCSAAYKKLVAAGLGDGDNADLVIRGLYATGDTPVADPWALRVAAPA